MKCNFCESESSASLLMMEEGFLDEIFFCQDHLLYYSHKGHEFKISYAKSNEIEEDMIVEDSFVPFDNKKLNPQSPPIDNIEELEEEMKTAVKNEDYILAGKLRDTIRRIKNESS